MLAADTGHRQVYAEFVKDLLIDTHKVCFIPGFLGAHATGRSLLLTHWAPALQTQTNLPLGTACVMFNVWCGVVSRVLWCCGPSPSCRDSYFKENEVLEQIDKVRRAGAVQLPYH